MSVRTRVVGAVSCLAMVFLLAGWPARGEASPPASARWRVLIITGKGDHDWRSTTPFLRQALEATGRFEVYVCEASAGLTAGTLAGFDVVVHDAGRPNAGVETEKAIDDFVRSGKGMIVTHGGLDGPPGVLSESRAHLAVGLLEIKLTRPDHPIVAGLPAEWKTVDSCYAGLKAAPGAEVLATSAGEPALLVSHSGKGRVFTTALGHDLAAMQEPWFMTIFIRAAEWAATGSVTPPAKSDPARPRPHRVKAILITGGHEHDALFYALFAGMSDLAGLPVATPEMVFHRDLRGKYDVIIMYDFTRDLDEAGRKNLRNFVENGGGVVVLHHGLLDYQTWTWWREEAVGCSYRLQTEGKIRSSTVKDRTSFFVTPDRQHPITARLEPFHLVDEAYKRMWFSPRVQPLLVTDNPNSDPVVGWVGPSPGFRVVAVELGHGPEAFTHPTYRAFVHNAILWAAGRLK